MSFHTPTPAVSELIRKKTEFSQEDQHEHQKTNREDWKKQKELEEARKAGTAPAAVDETGKDINPHIPQYISSAPWYYAAQGPTLRHQRVQEENKKQFSGLEDWYKKGVDTSKISTRYRKGACENCGALTHKKKDCLERPRKIGAKFTNTEIAPDEHLQPNLALDFDGKRDRWNGYDPNEHLAIVDEFQKIEEAKRHLKSEKLKTTITSDELPDNMVEDTLEEDDELEQDEDKYVDDIDMPGTKMDSKERITVRNLRIREDTAKYLRNLDPNSAYYDPKTRSMRDNPYKNTGKVQEELDFAGENFVRFTGDTNRHAQAQLFAWEAQEKGVDVHLLAEPTKLEVLKKEFEKKKEEFKGGLNRGIVEKYGGDEFLGEGRNKALLLGQTEEYVEYSRQGKVIKGAEKATIRSKYEEDIWPGNHTSVFGSYWRAGSWGYACCHSLVGVASWCTGVGGREGNDGRLGVGGSVGGGGGGDYESLEFGRREEGEGEEEVKSLVEIHREMRRKKEEGVEEEEEEEEIKEVKKKDKKKKNQKKRDKKRRARRGKKGGSKRKEEESSSSSSSSSEDSSSEEEDEQKKKKRELADALAAEEARQKAAESMMDDRKRGYNSRYEVQAPTEMEIEAYLIKRQREEDPMLQFMEGSGSGSGSKKKRKD